MTTIEHLLFCAHMHIKNSWVTQSLWLRFRDVSVRSSLAFYYIKPPLPSPLEDSRSALGLSPSSRVFLQQNNQRIMIKIDYIKNNNYCC